MDSVNLNITLGLNYKLDFDKDREVVRKNIENFIIQDLMTNGKQTMRELGKEIENTGYINEYGETDVHLQFNLETKNKLDFCEDTSDYLDVALIEEEWMDLSIYNNLEQQLKKLSYNTASNYNEKII